MDYFVADLRDRVDSVRALGLTLESFLDRVVLPEDERAYVVREVCTRLALTSASDPLAPVLG